MSKASNMNKRYERPELQVIHLQPGAALLQGMTSGEAGAPRYVPDED